MAKTFAQRVQAVEDIKAEAKKAGRPLVSESAAIQEAGRRARAKEKKSKKRGSILGGFKQGFRGAADRFIRDVSGGRKKLK